MHNHLHLFVRVSLFLCLATTRRWCAPFITRQITFIARSLCFCLRHSLANEYFHVAPSHINPLTNTHIHLHGPRHSALFSWRPTSLVARSSPCKIHVELVLCSIINRFGNASFFVLFNDSIFIDGCKEELWPLIVIDFMLFIA